MQLRLAFRKSGRQCCNRTTLHFKSLMLVGNLDDVKSVGAVFARCASIMGGYLYRALSPGGNPSFETILKATLGLKVTIRKTV